jgi:small subunit ribosomal protein S21
MKSYNKNRQNFNNKFDNNRFRKDDNRPKPQGLQVFVREGEDISKALRKLKKKVEAAGILKDLRDKQFYEKPSEKRRKAKKAGVARWKKRQKELEFSR